MSFAGNLEHMPIVDVIQLLHSTRKTGTLCLKCPKGESQLGFQDGYIVSANHLNNSLRIGRILVEMNAISQDALEKALQEQKKAGGPPLIALLIESGQVKKEVAFKALQTLIELTIVEVLTWLKGSFIFEVEKIVVSDEYRYFPEKLKQDLYINTQNILMDALRIYDEKKRDGSLKDEDFSSFEQPAGENAGIDISADILGLDDLDKIEKKAPKLLPGQKDEDSIESHRKKISEILTDIPAEKREKFVMFLMKTYEMPKIAQTAGGSLAQALIVFSSDNLIKHTLTAVTKYEGMFLFTTDDEVNLDMIIDQSISRGLVPILVIDVPDTAGNGFTEEKIGALWKQKIEKYPQIIIVQLIPPGNDAFSLKALKKGVKAVIPKPVAERKDSYVEEMMEFFKAFFSYIKKCLAGPDQQVFKKFRDLIVELDGLGTAAEASFVLLRFVSSMFERSLTLVVGKSELIAERGIGIKADKAAGPTPPLKFKIPLTPSVLQTVTEKGALYFGAGDDAILKAHLYKEIGAPHESKILLLPLKNAGKVIAVTYGDFGSKPLLPVHIDLLEIMARHANQVLDLITYQKLFEKSAK